MILGHHKTRRDRGVLDRLQQPVEFFSIHGVLLSAQLTVRLSLIGIVHIRLLYPVSLRECDQLAGLLVIPFGQLRRNRRQIAQQASAGVV